MLNTYLQTQKAKIVPFVTLIMSAVILISTSGPASAQSTRERITALEKQLNAVQRRVFTPGSRFQSGGGDAASAPSSSAPIELSGAGGGLVADINIRISELETQLRDLTGMIEQSNFKVDTMTRKVESMEKDYEFRLSEMERGGTGGGSSTVASGTGTSSFTPSAIPMTSTPKQQYDQAYSLVSGGDYAEAEINLLQFLKDHPEDTLAGNAQYWLGQTYYARGNYSSATRTFLEGMSRYPESPKAPAFLLKVGMSLNNLGEKGEACEVYRELDARFPDSTENTRMRAAEERKAGCS